MLPPTCIWVNFKKWVFVYQQAVSVFCEIYPLIVVTAINSHSESIANHYSKNPSGGQDKPAGIGCPHPSSKVFKVTDECKQAENVWIIRKFHHFKHCNTSKSFHYV